MGCKVPSDAILRSKLLPKGMVVPGSVKRSLPSGSNLRVVCGVKEHAPSVAIPDGIGLSMEVAVAEEKMMMKRKEDLGGGRFGRYGGKYVPETLMSCLAKLEAEFSLVLNDHEFQVIVNFNLYIYYQRKSNI